MGPTHFDTKKFRKKFESVENLSRMCFEHVCFVNHSKCLKEIWVQKYLGAKKFLPKIVIQIFFPNSLSYVLNQPGMCIEYDDS